MMTTVRLFYIEIFYLSSLLIFLLFVFTYRSLPNTENVVVHLRNSGSQQIQRESTIDQK